tara:strand:- start:4170 stop:5432 length:1263 start_codon:yes stop_codon:yes gene_type:complete
MKDMETIGKSAKEAFKRLAVLNTETRNKGILSIADALISAQDLIVTENAKDIRLGEEKGLSPAVLDRLLLNRLRLESMSSDMVHVAGLPDPIGEIEDMNVMPNGMEVGRKRVPLGVIGVIYESRPNVTIDISSLCLKSGNAVILRGGSESFYSNTVLTEVIQDAVSKVGVPKEAVQYVESTDRALVTEMLNLSQYIDLMIPRGGKDLVDMVNREAKMPSITGGVGVCHAYVDESASIDMAVEVVYNSKVQRPSVCNALDTILVHASSAPNFLPQIANVFADAGVEMRCDIRSLSILGSRDDVKIKTAGSSDWDTEHLSLTVGVKVVDSLSDALEHIDQHGTGHTEAIITENDVTGNIFLQMVDSSAVMLNASTRFNDGGEFGLGAEVAISTNKLHARGPMGLRELTSYKWLVLGNGHIRN